MNREEDEEKPQSSRHDQRQTEHMEIEADGDDCREAEPARNSDPGRLLQPDTEDRTSGFSVAETEVSCEDWEETREPHSGLNSLMRDEDPVHNKKCNSPNKTFSC